MSKTIIKKKDGEVWCYGVLQDNSNFDVICDNEAYDGIYANGNPKNDGGGFSSWQEVVNHLLNNYRHDIEEISAV